MKIGLLAKAWRVVRAHPLKRIQKTLNRCMTALAIVLRLVVIAAPSAQAQTFDAPGAGTGPLQGTIGVGINTAGVITGICYDASNLADGFVRAADGTITRMQAMSITASCAPRPAL